MGFFESDSLPFVRHFCTALGYRVHVHIVNCSTFLPQHRRRGCLAIFKSSVAWSRFHVVVPCLGAPPTIKSRAVALAFSHETLREFEQLHLTTHELRLYSPFERNVAWPSGSYERIIRQQQQAPTVVGSIGFAALEFSSPWQGFFFPCGALRSPSFFFPQNDPPEQLRWPTTRELARLQGVPEEQPLLLHRRRAVLAIGNAIPPPLALVWLHAVVVAMQAADSHCSVCRFAQHSLPALTTAFAASLLAAVHPKASRSMRQLTAHTDALSAALSQRIPLAVLSDVITLLPKFLSSILHLSRASHVFRLFAQSIIVAQFPHLAAPQVPSASALAAPSASDRNAPFPWPFWRIPVAPRELPSSLLLCDRQPDSWPLSVASPSPKRARSSSPLPVLTPPPLRHLPPSSPLLSFPLSPLFCPSSFEPVVPSSPVLFSPLPPSLPSVSASPSLLSLRDVRLTYIVFLRSLHLWLSVPAHTSLSPFARHDFQLLRLCVFARTWRAITFFLSDDFPPAAQLCAVRVLRLSFLRSALAAP